MSLSRALAALHAPGACLDFSSATRLAAQIHSGERSALAVCEHFLARARAYDAELNAFVELYPEAARAQAQAFRAPPVSGLSGVPIGIKDLQAIRGTFMRLGSTATRNFYTPVDDLVVSRLRRAGLVFIGKTTTSEFGVLPVTEPRTHAPTRNPYNLALSAGGSSGGAAAAVCAGLLPIALGTDGGGSVRIPAAFTGLVGFKPSRGLVPNPFGRDSERLIWTCGPIANSVADAAALLELLVDPGESLVARGLGALLRRRAGWEFSNASPKFVTLGAEAPARKLRVRFTCESPLGRALPSIQAAVERVVGVLAAEGHEVREGAPIRGSNLEEFLVLWQANTAQAPVLNFAHTEPVTRWLGEAGRKLKALRVAELSDQICGRVAAWFGDADLWVTPTVGLDPPEIGAWTGLPAPDTYEAAARYLAFTALFNVTGQPAISLPAGFSEKKMPIGIQLIGRYRADAQLLGVAQRVEAALAWAPLRASFLAAAQRSTTSQGPNA